MRTKIFYRIEYEDSDKGLYESGLVSDTPKLNDMMNRHNNPEILPNTFLDLEIREYIRANSNTHFRFCFNSESDMNRLITRDELYILIGLGCRIYTIETQDYFSSKYQTIVNKDTIISKLDVTHLYD